MLLGAAAALQPSHITIFLVSLALLLGLSRVLGELARQYRQPAILGEIIAGVLLGPTVFGFVSPDWFTFIFPEVGPTRVALDGFVLMAAVLLLLVVGLDVDLSTVWRQGKTALTVSATGIVLPFTFGFGLAWLFKDSLGAGSRAPDLPFAIFFGIALSITALPVIAKILMDLNIAKSDMGMLIISAAMFNDLVGWIGFAMVLGLLAHEMPVVAADASAAAAHPGVGMTIGLTFAFLVFMLTIGRWLCHRLLPYVQAHWSWPGGVLVFVFVIALLCAAFTEWLGIHSIFGAFVAGVVLGDSSHLRERTRDTIHQFITNIFAPVFFASIGLRLNFVEAFQPGLVALVVCTAFIGKVGGTYFGARSSRMSPRESWATGFGMVSQGAVGIILGQLARQAELITDELMVAIVIMALSTSLISGPAMQAILRSKTRRALKDFLSDRHILTQPRAHTVEGAVREMSRRAADITGRDEQHIHDAVMQRERIMHTGLPGGIAVPHARLDDLTRPCVIIGRHRDGIDFDAPDGQPARIVCLLLTPSDQPDSQIELLDLVVRTFGRPDVKQRVLHAATPTELLAILNQAASEPEQSLVPHDDETLGVS